MCIRDRFVIGCTPKTTMIEIQKHVYVEKEFKDSWLEMNEFGDSYIKEELQGGYGYSYDDQYLEIFFNSGGKIELYTYSIKKDNLIISGEIDVYKRPPERVTGHTGTETRPRLLREAAVGNFRQWGKP